MAHSDAVYVIHDRAIKVDVFMFMAQHDGIAKGHLHSFTYRKLKNQSIPLSTPYAT